jgi:hypothetical protein
MAGPFRERLLVRYLSSNLFSYIAERIGDFETVCLDFVLNIGEPRIEARFGCVYAFFQPLERAGDGNCDVVAVLVNETLDTFEVFLL